MSTFRGLIVKAVLRLVAGGLSPSHPALYAHLAGGHANHAGKPMGTDAALSLSTTYSCAELISSTIATLPLALYHDLGGGEAEIARRHPLYSILHDAPNADQTAVEFWQWVLLCLVLKGNAFCEIRWANDARSRVVALSPIPVEAVSIRILNSGARLYTVKLPNQRERELDERDVMHIKTMSLDGIWGLSKIAAARHTLGTAYAAEESAGKLFANGMQTSGYVTVDTFFKRDERARFRANLDEYAGSENAGKVFLLEGGAKYSPMSLPPADAELLGSRQWSVEEICRWFRVPPHMVGHTEKVTSWGTGLEQQVLGFATFTLRPYLKTIEQSIKRSLIPSWERDTLYAEYNIEGLLRADSAGRAAFYAQMVQNGIYTRNECRSKENMSRAEGADELTVQSNQIPLSRLGEVTSVTQLEAPTP